MPEAKLRRDLRAAFANRAMLYLTIYRSLEAALGVDRAEELLSAGVRRRCPAACWHRPRRATWQGSLVEAGLVPDLVAKLCRSAGKIDNGMFETAGFTFTSETWMRGCEGCCRLRVRPGPAKPGSVTKP